jgi:GNAT superfamily N-acetyltransferase
MESMIALSPIDEARFGIRTAKVTGLTEACLPETLEFCDREGVRFLIARCLASDLSLVHRLERDGFLLMDTLVYYRRKNLADIPVIADPPDIVVRPVQLGEETLVRVIAEQSFQGYGGHYHADPRLDRRHCDEAYVDWAVRSCDLRGAESDVLVAATPHGLLGFATLRLATPGEGEGVLFCVAPPAQGKGIYRLFMIRGMEWSRAHGAKRMIVSTQATHLVVQKAWVRLGFEPSELYYTFHRWFD